MYASQRLLRKIEQIRKSHWDDQLEDQTEFLSEAFAASLPHLPNGMAEEVFQHFWSTSGCASREDFYGPCAQRLADALDLFHGTYDEENDPLLPVDWEVVRDVVSERATELDMELVNYLMRLVVDHGAL